MQPSQTIARITLVYGCDTASLQQGSAVPRIFMSTESFSVCEELPATYSFMLNGKSASVSKRYDLFPFEVEPSVTVLNLQLEEGVDAKTRKNFAAKGVLPLKLMQVYARPDSAQQAKRYLLELLQDDMRKSVDFRSAVIGVVQSIIDGAEPESI